MPRRYEDDDDDDDDRRRRRRRRDDDDDDTPRRRNGGGSGIGVVIVFGLVGVLGLFAAIGVIAYVLLRSGDKDDPEVVEQPAATNKSGNPPVQLGPRPDDTPPRNPKPKDNTPPITPQPPPKKSNPAPAPGVLPLPSINPLVQQIIFGGTPEDGYAGIVAYRKMGVGQQIDVVKTSTGAVQGQVVTDSATEDGNTLSHDGKWLAVRGSAPFAGHPVRVYHVADGKEEGTFTPYPRNQGNNNFAPELVWVAFVTADRLLTINEASGFDMWAVPGFKRIAGQGGRQMPVTTRVDSNGFTRSPNNFAISPDGMTFAIFNGSAFAFYNLQTGAEIARTDAIVRAPNAVNFAGAALSPDGSRFACFYTVFGGGGGPAVRVWDVKTGKEVAGGPVKAIHTPAGFAWWGPNHLVFWKGGISDADLFSIESSTVIGRVRTTVPGKLATVPPNGQLWWVTGGALFDPDTGAAFLVRADIPTTIPAKADFELTQNGLKPK